MPKTAAKTPWRDVIEAGRGEQLVRQARYGARPAETAAAPGRAPPGAARVARPRGHRRALLAPGRGLRRRDAGARDRHDRHGERQVARVQPARARHARARPARPRALPLPDEGARPGPGAQAARAARAVPAPRDLRRRHAEGGAPRDPGPVEPDPHEPGHAERGRPAPPPQLGRRAGEPRLGRGGRGARLPRRVRLARGERAAAPAPARARVRHRAALRADERDDRQPARAGRAADRARPRARRPRRRAARRAPGRDVEPAARRRGRGHPRLGAVGGGAAPRGADAGRGAHDLLPQVAPRRRADPALHASCGSRTRAAATSPSGSRPTARATRRRSGARSSGGSPRATCSPSSPPTRSSSGSTSATSTPPSA